MNYAKEKREFRNKRYYFANKITSYLSGLCLASEEGVMYAYIKKINEYLELLENEILKEIAFDKLIDSN